MKALQRILLLAACLLVVCGAVRGEEAHAQWARDHYPWSRDQDFQNIVDELIVPLREDSREIAIEKMRAIRELLLPMSGEPWKKLGYYLTTGWIDEALQISIPWYQLPTFIHYANQGYTYEQMNQWAKQELGLTIPKDRWEAFHYFIANGNSYHDATARRAYVTVEAEAQMRETGVNKTVIANVLPFFDHLGSSNYIYADVFLDELSWLDDAELSAVYPLLRRWLLAPCWYEYYDSEVMAWYMDEESVSPVLKAFLREDEILVSFGWPKGRNGRYNGSALITELLKLKGDERTRAFAGIKEQLIADGLWNVLLATGDLDNGKLKKADKALYDQLIAEQRPSYIETIRQSGLRLGLTEQEAGLSADLFDKALAKKAPQTAKSLSIKHLTKELAALEAPQMKAVFPLMRHVLAERGQWLDFVSYCQKQPKIVPADSTLAQCIREVRTQLAAISAPWDIKVLEAYYGARVSGGTLSYKPENPQPKTVFIAAPESESDVIAQVRTLLAANGFRWTNDPDKASISIYISVSHKKIGHYNPGRIPALSTTLQWKAKELVKPNRSAALKLTNYPPDQIRSSAAATAYTPSPGGTKELRAFLDKLLKWYK